VQLLQPAVVYCALLFCVVLTSILPTPSRTLQPERRNGASVLFSSCLSHKSQVTSRKSQGTIRKAQQGGTSVFKRGFLCVILPCMM